MKFAVSAEQRDYLRKKGILPIEGLLRAHELRELNLGIAEVQKEFSKQDPWMVGRDLWRRNEKIKKIVFSKRLAELAFELLQKKPLRIAFDQFLPPNFGLQKTLPKDCSIQEASCITLLHGLYILCLKTDKSDDNDELEAQGGGYFVLPSSPFPFEMIKPSCSYFLIGYGDLFSQYLFQPNDPHVHFLKSFGYVFGDKLHERFHPLLLR